MPPSEKMKLVDMHEGFPLISNGQKLKIVNLEKKEAK